jgi:hypothetical protein
MKKQLTVSCFIHVGELTGDGNQRSSNVQGVLVTGVDPDSGVAELQKGM